MDGTGGKLDISGSAVDPFDDNAVWMIQKYAYRRAEGDGDSRFVVGKVFGQRHADLFISDLSIVRLADGRLQVSGQIGNGGDELADDVTLAVRLVARSPSGAAGVKGLLLDELSLGRIPPGASTSFSQLVVLPPGAPSRLNIVEASGATRDQRAEYTYDNNTVGLPLQAIP